MRYKVCDVSGGTVMYQTNQKKPAAEKRMELMRACLRVMENPHYQNIIECLVAENRSLNETIRTCTDMYEEHSALTVSHIKAILALEAASP